MIPDAIIEEERLNRKLRREVANIQHHERTLIDAIQQLEDRNMELICKSVQVDWNLMYEEDELPDDYWPEERSQNWNLYVGRHLPSEITPHKLNVIDVDDKKYNAGAIIQLQIKLAKTNINNNTMSIRGKELGLTNGYEHSAGQKFYKFLPGSKTTTS